MSCAQVQQRRPLFQPPSATACFAAPEDPPITSCVSKLRISKEPRKRWQSLCLLLTAAPPPLILNHSRCSRGLNLACMVMETLPSTPAHFQLCLCVSNQVHATSWRQEGASVASAPPAPPPMPPLFSHWLCMHLTHMFVFL